MAEWSGSGSPLKGPVHQVLAPGKGAVKEKGNIRPTTQRGASGLAGSLPEGERKHSAMPGSARSLTG